jgi:hypothetical protein
MRILPLFLFLAACGGGPAPAAPAPTCAAIDGVDALLKPGATVLLGEMHGTAESPRFVGDLACHAAQRGPVTIALEIPQDEQPRIDRYLASAGTDADRAALLDSEFWTRPDQDGRSSQAMLALIERARADHFAVNAFDIPSGVQSTTRDRDMAATFVAARKAAPDAIVVGLTGNYHSRKSIGARWDPAMKFMARYIEELGVPLTTLDVARDGGSAWVCMADDAGAMSCGENSAPPQPRDRSWYLTLGGDIPGHDGQYIVGPTTASPPAAR